MVRTQSSTRPDRQPTARMEQALIGSTTLVAGAVSRGCLLGHRLSWLRWAFRIKALDRLFGQHLADCRNDDFGPRAALIMIEAIKGMQRETVVPK